MASFLLRVHRLGQELFVVILVAIKFALPAQPCPGIMIWQKLDGMSCANRWDNTIYIYMCVDSIKQKHVM